MADSRVIRCADIRESTANPRRHFDEVAMRDLIESINAHGLLQPILVRESAPDVYELIAGARRLRAIRLLDRETIAALVVSVEDDQAAEMRLVENLQREDLNPIEEARGFAALRDVHGKAVQDISAHCGKSERYVRDRLLLLELPEAVQQLVATGKLNLACALLLARAVRDPERAVVAAQKIAFGRGWQPSDQHDEDCELRPMTLRAAREYLVGEVLLDLKQAPFPTDDVVLLEAAGACVACPKALQPERDLFGELWDSAPWSCTDATCYQAKIDAAVARRQRAIEARGVTCEVDDSRAEDTSPARWDRTINPQSICYQDVQRRPWSEVLGKAGQKLPVTLVRTPDGWEERVSREDAMRIARPELEKQQKSKKESPYVDSAADKASRRERHEARMRVVERFTAALIATSRDDRPTITINPFEVWRRILRMLDERWCNDATDRVRNELALNLDLPIETLGMDTSEALTVQQRLCGLAVAFMALEAPSSEWAHDYADEFVDAAELIGFDIEAAEREIEAESAPPTNRAKKGKRAAAGDDDEAEPAEATPRGKRAKGGRQ